MMKICRKIPVICQENRKAWLEKQNAMIKCNSVTPEPSVLESSVLSHNVSLNSLSELPGEFSSRNACCRSKLSPSQIFFEYDTSMIHFGFRVRQVVSYEKNHSLLPFDKLINSLLVSCETETGSFFSHHKNKSLIMLVRKFQSSVIISV